MNVIRCSSIVLLSASLGLACAPANSQQRYCTVSSFRLESGAVLEHCTIGYRTYGTRFQDGSNAVLMPTWLGGRSEDLVSLLGAHALVDTTRFFAILVDAFGDGISASPSNDPEMRGGGSPDVSIGDMVRAQRLLLDSLGLGHLAAVVGGSMGGMQALEWALRYPEMMQRIVAYVATPRCTASDVFLWRAELQAIEDGKRFGESDTAIARRVCMINLLAIRTPSYQSRSISSDSAAPALETSVHNFQERFRADDWAMQVRAILGQDVARIGGGDVRHAASLLRAKLFLIVSRQDQMVNPGPAIAFARMTRSRLLILDNDCGHLAPSCEFERFARQVREFLER